MLEESDVKGIESFDRIISLWISEGIGGNFDVLNVLYCINDFNVKDFDIRVISIDWENCPACWISRVYPRQLIHRLTGNLYHSLESEEL